VASKAELYVTTVVPAAAWRWRAAAAVALLAALALFALTLAHWGWIWFGPTPTVIALPAPETDLARRAAEARLFGTAGAVPGNAPAGADLGDVRLLGVFAETGGKGYALLRAGTRAAVLVAAGQDIAPGMRVESVRPDGVSVLQGGARRELSLRPQAVADRPRVAAAAPSGPAGCAIPAGFKGPVVRLNAELLGGMIDAPDAWKVLVAPASGALMVRDQSGFAGMLGLKNGDRVERANGIALALPDDIAATILRPLTRSQPVWLAGTREGKPQQWLYLNAGSCPA
jgi:general secretion pathway protein C